MFSTLKGNVKYIVLIALLLAFVEVAFFGGTPEVIADDSIELPSVDYWEMFAGISKERKYFEEVDTHYRVPVFTEELQKKEGETIVLSGFFLPYSKIDSLIIISRYPNSSCFFCGQAGIESVAMVELDAPNPDTYIMDQMLLVKGKLELNSSDINRLAFVIKEASVVELGL